MTNLRKGSIVQALWPDDGLYYGAVVMDVSGNMVKVRWADGASISTLESKNVRIAKASAELKVGNTVPYLAENGTWSKGKICQSGPKNVFVTDTLTGKLDGGPRVLFDKDKVDSIMKAILSQASKRNGAEWGEIVTAIKNIKGLEITNWLTEVRTIVAIMCQSGKIYRHSDSNKEVYQAR